MNGETKTGGRKRLRNVSKWLGIAAIVVAIAALGAHLNWKYSSYDWKLVRTTAGIQVFERKTSGAVMKEFKGVMRVNAKLDAIAALMLDPKVCELEDYGCYESIALQKVDEQRGGTGYYSFKWRYPFKFQPRHYVIKTNFTQDPETKEVFETVEAIEDRLPTADGHVRVTHMKNSWRLTPMDGGQVQIEYVVDTAAGGFFPYFLDNMGGPEYVPFLLKKLPRWLENDKYKNADVPFIAEK